MDLRKVQEMGGGTFLVSLPKEWVKKNMLQKGSVLTLDIKGNGCLIIYPFQKEERSISEIILKYTEDQIDNLINSIIGSYLFGYDIIKIQGNNIISYENRRMIKKAIKQLIGVEIIEENTTSLIIQFLLEPTSFSPEKIFRRMHTLSKEMCKDAITSILIKDVHLVKIVTERDDEIDRLHFFLVRLVRSALLDSKLLRKFEFNPLDCLDYRVASTLLETIGDVSIEIVENLLKTLKFQFNEELINFLKEVQEKIMIMQDLAVKAFLTKSVNDARKVIEIYDSFRIRLKKIKLPEQPLLVFTGISTIIASINKICRCHVDIADLAVPMYPKIG